MDQVILDLQELSPLLMESNPSEPESQLQRDIQSQVENSGAHANAKSLTVRFKGNTLLLEENANARVNRRATGYDDAIRTRILNYANDQEKSAKVNEKDENTGETPLHQAAILGRLEATKLLLDNHADVGARDKEGANALHACALKGHVPVLKLLLGQSSVKECISVLDSMGEMPIHKAARRGHTECIQLLLKAGADLGAKTGEGESATTLILQLPLGAEILRKMFDKNIGLYGKNKNHERFRMKFDYSLLLPTETKHKSQQIQVVMDIVDQRGQPRIADLLQHPIIESFLVLKWSKVQYFFYFNLFWYIMLAVFESLYVWLSIVRSPSRNLTEIMSNSTDNHQVTNQPDDGTWTFIPTAIVIPMIIVQELFLLSSLRRQYFCQVETYIKLGAIFTCIVVISPPPPLPLWIHHVSAFSVLFAWVEVTFLFGRIPTFGVYALMFYSVAKHIFKFIFVFLFFLTGFAFSFFIMFSEKNKAFDSFWTSLFRTFAIMVGDAEYNDYMASDKQSFGWTAQLIYFTFLLLVSLTLMNLLIGLAVDDIRGLQQEGRVERIRKKAELILCLEDMATNRYLLRLLSCTSLKERFTSWLNLKTELNAKNELNFFPYGKRGKKLSKSEDTNETKKEEQSQQSSKPKNDNKTTKPRFSARIVERAIAIVKEKEDKEKTESFNNSQSKRMQKIESLLSKISKSVYFQSLNQKSIDQRGDANA